MAFNSLNEAGEIKIVPFIVVMGVAGTGKSTLGHGLARALGISYVEGDDLHPRSNVEKMSAGMPLTDADREPWLALIRRTAEERVKEQIGKSRKEGEEDHGEQERKYGVVISSSALKKYYRDILRGKSGGDNPGPTIPNEAGDSVPTYPRSASTHYQLGTYFVFINGPRELMEERIAGRKGHFMKPQMLESQLRTLESPVGEEGVVQVELKDSTEEQIRVAIEGLERSVGRSL